MMQHRRYLQNSSTGAIASKYRKCASSQKRFMD